MMFFSEQSISLITKLPTTDLTFNMVASDCGRYRIPGYVLVFAIQTNNTDKTVFSVLAEQYIRSILSFAHVFSGCNVNKC